MPLYAQLTAVNKDETQERETDLFKANLVVSAQLSVVQENKTW